MTKVKKIVGIEILLTISSVYLFLSNNMRKYIIEEPIPYKIAINITYLISEVVTELCHNCCLYLLEFLCRVSY
jgi:hypothetical protein